MHVPYNDSFVQRERERKYNIVYSKSSKVILLYSAKVVIWRERKRENDLEKKNLNIQCNESGCGGKRLLYRSRKSIFVYSQNLTKLGKEGKGECAKKGVLQLRLVLAGRRGRERFDRA